MDINHKLKVLSTIAKALNEHQIGWAVGGSLLLFLKGKTEGFNDIDLMVMDDAAEAVVKILLQHGALVPSKVSAHFKTKYFYEFVIDGVGVDVMAGMVIINQDKEHSFSLKAESVVEYVLIYDVEIPLQSLAEWRNLYLLMGRHDKVAMIDQ